MNTTDLEIVVKARELISDPQHWTKEVYARRADGSVTEVDAIDVHCLCAIGALRAAIHKRALSRNRFGVAIHAFAISRRIEQVADVPCLAAFNDGHEHAEVLALYDRVITAARVAIRK